MVAPDVYAEWLRRFTQVNTSNDASKEERLGALYDELEQDLKYLGSTAIEDLLQEEVPQTIKDLMNAGIKIWVLTGDKQETAIEIGKLCNLIDLSTMDLIVLSSQSKEEFLDKLKDAFNTFVR